AKHPTTKMLALAFLLLIGVSLVADGMGFHIEKGYIYAAMGFSVLVEAVNIFAKQRRLARGTSASHATAGSAIREEVAHSKPLAVAAGPAPSGAAAAPPIAKATSASSTRSQARPKGAPRKKSWAGSSAFTRRAVRRSCASRIDRRSRPVRARW